MSEKNWRTPEETADIIGVTTVTLCNWRKEGKGPKFSQPSRKVYYFMTDIEDWMRGDNFKQAGEITNEILSKINDQSL